jgi:putative membrane protein
MSDLNDPRVLFAAERTLLAWNRTAAGLMAFGFLVDRAGVIAPSAAPKPVFALWVGLVFVLLGALLCGLSVVQYRRAIASLRPVEIPARYWVNLSVHFTLLMGVLGLLLAVYLVIS